MFDKDEFNLKLFKEWEPENKISVTSLKRLITTLEDDKEFTTDEKAIDLENDGLSSLQINLFLSREYEYRNVKEWLTNDIKEMMIKIQRYDNLQLFYIEINKVQIGIISVITEIIDKNDGECILKFKTGMLSCNEKNIDTAENDFYIHNVENLVKYLVELYLYSSKLLSLYHVKKYVVTDPFRIII